MKKKDLRSYNLKKADELENELKSLKLDFTKTKLNIISGREKNLKKAKNIGKSISQITMLLNHKKTEEKTEVKV